MRSTLEAGQGWQAFHYSILNYMQDKPYGRGTLNLISIRDCYEGLVQTTPTCKPACKPHP